MNRLTSHFLWQVDLGFKRSNRFPGGFWKGIQITLWNPWDGDFRQVIQIEILLWSDVRSMRFIESNREKKGFFRNRILA